MTPARQMIPAILIGGFYAAYFIQETDFFKSRLFKLAAVISVLISYILMIVPALRYTSGKEKLYAVFEKMKFNFLWFFPSFNDIITSAHLIVLLYAAVIIVLFFRYNKTEEDRR